jgi:hypothetical protein
VSYTAAWLRGRAALHLARRLLDRHGDAAACEALWRLNRWARSHRGPRVAQVYALKNRMIRVLYERHGAEVYRDVQVFPCWGWRWEGCDGDDCEKCHGTGVFRTVRLLRFVFHVGGRRYTWHQPQDLVNWPIAAIENGDELEGGIGDDRAPAIRSVEAYCLAAAVVYLFLRRAGVRAEELPRIDGLWWSLRADVVRWAIYRYRYARGVISDRVWGMKWRLRRWRERRRARVETAATVPVSAEAFDGELPF